MESHDQELVKRLIEEDESFRENYRAHKDYETKISKLEKKSHLSPEDSVEKSKLKKLKLALKEEMEKTLARHRAN